jgi:hypothetical protein
VPPQYPPPQPQPQFQYPPPQPVVIEKNSGPSEFEYNALKEKVWNLERTANDLRNDVKMVVSIVRQMETAGRQSFGHK